MEPRTLIVHIGMPKTGTTYLQQAVFPELPGVSYLGKLETDILQPDEGPRYGLLDRFFQYSTRVWEELGNRLFDRIAAETDGACRRVLISDEGVSTAGRRPEHLALHLRCLVDHAARHGFASVKLICCIRRQDQWLGSHYAQMSDRNAHASQKDFERFVRATLDPTQHRYRDGMLLDYEAMRDALGRGVGPGRVLMLPYELMLADPAAYLRRLFGFIDAGRAEEGDALSAELGARAETSWYNRRSSKQDRWAVRPLSHGDARTIRLRPARVFAAVGLPTVVPLRLPDLGRPAEVVLTPALKAAILDVYAPQNRAVADALSIDLALYGYY